jgi:hypothetical protein
MKLMHEHGCGNEDSRCKRRHLIPMLGSVVVGYFATARSQSPRELRRG